MKNRRELIAGGAAALPGTVLGAEPREPAPCLAPGGGPSGAYFPNPVLTTHLGSRVRFYDDLLAGRIVMVNFMSIAGEAKVPVTANLARAQRHLEGRLGRDVFLYSLTVDPANDTPRALASFAARHGARPGWLFLTGEESDLETLRSRFFVDRVARHQGHAGGHAAGPDCSLGLLRYGNEAAGVWGSCPVVADPRWIAGRLAWVTPQERRAGRPRRRGPLPLGARSQA